MVPAMYYRDVKDTCHRYSLQAPARQCALGGPQVWIHRLCIDILHRIHALDHQATRHACDATMQVALGCLSRLGLHSGAQHAQHANAWSARLMCTATACTEVQHQRGTGRSQVQP
jgi:hypothetical protein